MILQISIHCNKPQLCIITTIFFLATIVLSSNPKFEACTPRSCGAGPPIKYPFWIPYEQESFCGYPEFEITCIDKNPILRTSNNDLLVKDISYSNSSFTVANIAVYEDKCPVPMYNYSLDQTPFTYSSENWNLSFFYNCTTEPIDYPTYKVDCAKNATHYSFAVFHKEALEHKNYSLNECQFMVNVPLNMNAAVNFTSLLRMNYTEILKMGFLLNWTAPDCQNCEKSGGRCGFVGNKFLCFCKDKSYLKSCGNGTLNLPRKIIIGVGSAVVGALAVGIGVYLYWRRKKNSYVTYIQSRSLSFDPSLKDTEKGTQSFTQSFVHGMHLFSYDELEEATNYFDSSKELGEGGFGTVYYGKLRDGRSVAVKRLYENNYRRVEQFMNEIKILALLKHPNLVSLYGCTSRHSRELLLVYEYIPNGTVADHLHSERSKPGTLPWLIRMNIAVETASALTYLHVKDIIHRDVKTNNILLDSNFRVKVADFGLSRLFPEHVTHVSTAPQGTPGYVDPEYHECYQLTNKSDVYSFGVVLVELISSLPAVDITRHRHEINLANMAINKIHSQALHELVDPTLGFESDFKVRKMINAVAELAFQCLQSSKDMRPSMEEVFDTLKDIQSDGKHKSQPEVMDISSTADDVVLLKDNPPPPSPDSNAVSKSTTPNASG
ncbi:LEAF RUST 10 DISEASE-RESISTANCE LOCUS RECEPTOR-LIKE PROTEIN KINASE-like 1.2 isoform X3 [Cajanus cajan]|uniref:LEAF RUST 10 DISEASE-RESISTANCE LOCUS RECEPTOR-LIKE PROTEIN KINASE-like 1.2 isoform X3 n=1 Tax=Cajanus cajan TaxID=3821 RepID=UPI00098D9ECC|nr:LEAF RUST 10 DISEASE-RESISTANCE LOCUS RECEPTOR-LIKE PROTEIN KINASE-like 1.2 isoform X3 [Cajanus cajan]